MVSWDAQVFSAVVSALLAFPGTEVTKLPKYPAPWVAPSPCHPHPRAATVHLVPDGGQTLWSFPMKDKGAGDRERGIEADQMGAKLSPREGGGQETLAPRDLPQSMLPGCLPVLLQLPGVTARGHVSPSSPWAPVGLEILGPIHGMTRWWGADTAPVSAYCTQNTDLPHF